MNSPSLQTSGDGEWPAQSEGEAADAATVAGGSTNLRAPGHRSAGPVARYGSPTLRVRSGKGGKTRLLAGASGATRGALSSALAYGDISQDRIVEAHPTTAWRWVKAAVKRAEELGAIAPGKRIGTHTLRHSYARHLLLNGIPINYLSSWLGHSSIQTKLIYLELVPDPTGSLAEFTKAWLAGELDDNRELHGRVIALAMMLPEYWNDSN